MKRKIGIIIAAAIVASGLLSGLLNGRAYAATGYTGSYYCYNGGTISGKDATACAYVLMTMHSDKVSHCPDTESTCKTEIGKHISVGNSIPDSNGAALAKTNSVNNIYTNIAAGPSTYDPCRDVTSYGVSSCQSSNSSIYNNNVGMSLSPYYYTPAGADAYDKKINGGGNNNSGGGGNDGSGGSNGSDPDPSSTKEPDADTGNCTSILTFISCDKDAKDGNGNGIVQMIKFIVSVMTGAVVIAGTVGIIICGVMMVTARDNEVQMTKARNRLIEVVIGIIAWALIAVLINFFIPQSESATDAITNPGVVIKEMRRK